MGCFEEAFQIGLSAGVPWSAGSAVTDAGVGYGVRIVRTAFAPPLQGYDHRCVFHCLLQGPHIGLARHLLE